MSMLARYKKKGGFFQLVQLIETSNLKKREQFLSLIKEESPIWESEIRKKILSTEKVLSWESNIISEVISRLPILTLSTILLSRSKEDYDKLYAILSFADQRKIQDSSASAPNAGEVQTSENKLLAEVRNLISLGTIKLEKIDPSLIIHDNIEETLESGNQQNILNSVLENSSPEINLTEISTKTNEVASSTNSGDNSSKVLTQKEIQDFDLLKKKVLQISNELIELKKENTILKDKLEKIKKIA